MESGVENELPTFQSSRLLGVYRLRLLVLVRLADGIADGLVPGVRVLVRAAPRWMRVGLGR
ncbi:MAG: hypothetical protein VKL39_13740 [Leptolyngbyaceae bacterium]|nr:hypothetical protein [Leptolyngbyaceae bacterium]